MKLHLDIIDGHCDLLYKMIIDPKVTFLQSGSRNNVSLPRLRKGNVRLQFFAIYLPENLRQPSFLDVITMIDTFREGIINHPDVLFIRSREELMEWKDKKSCTGALLTLEGADTLAGNPAFLRTAFALGVRLIGITWNHANWAVDGVGEERNGGFSRKGKRFIEQCNELGMILDCSHLSDAGFYELAEYSDKPFVASHSNARSICAHRRNLTDEQIRIMIAKDGRMGITFVPWFIGEGADASITNLIRHMDHVCSLGGVRNVGFGSDFDGMDQPLPGLSHPGQYVHLINELLKHFTEDEVKGFAGGNWLSFLTQYLPGK